MKRQEDAKLLLDVLPEIESIVLESLTNKEPLVVGLMGELGAGKTFLCQNLLKRLGVEEIVVSPTYVLHIPYTVYHKGNKYVINHIDAYRLNGFEELLRIGLAEMIENNEVILLEWADKFEGEIERLSPKLKMVKLSIDYSSDDNERFATLL